MVRKQWVWVVAAFLLVAVSACSSTSTVTPKPMDKAAIEADIRSQIATHYPGETFDIGIEVTDNGTVTLRGTVDDNDKRSRIEKMARGTSGVVRVVNEIKVKE
ncbi:MAG TPA: BON domain-containing protein [Thermoanaerobaculia bacterium]|jgi:osmotically-inducible protein OsmY|nr:BON domain-containing protein [Thermoanaerobaculia bacterium]